MFKIVRISGGLGNQLFQYAFGKYLEKKFNVIVKYDIQTILNTDNFTNREPHIIDLVKDINLIDIKKKLEISYRFKKILIKYCKINLFKIYIENDQNKLINQETVIKYNYFDGYWQSKIYVKTFKNEILFNDSIKKSCPEIFEHIYNCNSCSIHIRRGDYLFKNNIKIFSKCSYEYFYNAINLMKSIDKDIKFFVFSDDINSAKKFLNDNSFYFVNPNHSIPSIDLYLMSHCKHNIISNSTFSWWAAWLNTNQNKKVIAPYNWYVNQTINKITISKLIPNHWTIIR